jgi:hypothetical protein
VLIADGTYRNIYGLWIAFILFVGSCLLLHWTHSQRKWQQCEIDCIRPPHCTERASYTWTSPAGPCYGYTPSPGKSRPWSSKKNFEPWWVMRCKYAEVGLYDVHRNNLWPEGSVYPLSGVVTLFQNCTVT